IAPPAYVAAPLELSVIPASMLARNDPAPNVTGAEIVVLPSTLSVPVKITGDVPPIVAVPAAAAFAVTVALAVHCVGPLTFSVDPDPASTNGSSMSPSESNVVELIVKVTPLLIVCVVPVPVPSQSNV